MEDSLHEGEQEADASHLLTPVRADQLAMYLQNYDPVSRTLILTGFLNGFRSGYQDPEIAVEEKSKNISLENLKLVSDKIASEIKAGRISGLFTYPPFKNFHASQLFTVPVVVNHCFTLLFGTNGLLSDIVGYWDDC